MLYLTLWTMVWLHASPAWLQLPSPDAVRWFAHWPKPPDGQCYWEKREYLLLERYAYDATGARIENPNIEILVEPQSALVSQHVVVDDKKLSVMFYQPGDYLVTARLHHMEGQAASFTDVTQHFVVDSSPPHIALHSPLPAHTYRLNLSEQPQLPLHFDISEGSGLALVSINGQALPLLPMATTTATHEAFRTDLPVHWGINHLQIVAYDRCGNARESHYAFMVQPTAAELPAAPSPLLVKIHQSLLDNGQTQRDGSDVAGVLEQWLQQGGLQQLFPPQLPSAPPAPHQGNVCSWQRIFSHEPLGSQISRSGALSYKNVRIETIGIQEHGIEFALHLQHLRVPLRIENFRDIWCLGPTQTAQVQGSIVVDELRLLLRLHIDARENPVAPHWVVDDQTIRSEFSPGDPRFEADEVRWMGVMLPKSWYALLPGLHRDEQGMQQIARTNLQNLLLQSLSNVPRHMALTKTFAWPEHANSTLTVAAEWLDLQVGVASKPVMEASLQLWLQANPPAKATSSDDQLPGAIRHRAAPPNAQMEQAWQIFEEGQNIALRLRDDFINASLFAFWQLGALDIDDLQPFTRALGYEAPAFHMRLQSRMPPVLMPGEKDFEWILDWSEIELSGVVPNLAGNAQLKDGSTDVTPLHVYMGMRLPTRMQFDEASHSLFLRASGRPQFRVRIEAFPDENHWEVLTRQLQLMLENVATQLINQHANLDAYWLKTLPIPLPRLQWLEQPFFSQLQLTQLQCIRFKHQPETILRAKLQAYTEAKSTQAAVVAP